MDYRASHLILMLSGLHRSLRSSSKLVGVGVTFSHRQQTGVATVGSNKEEIEDLKAQLQYARAIVVAQSAELALRQDMTPVRHNDEG